MTGRAPRTQQIPITMTEEQWREKQKARYASAQDRAALLNSVLIGGMIAATIYASVASSPALAWKVSTALANLLKRRGINWQAAWQQASLLMMGS